MTKLDETFLELKKLLDDGKISAIIPIYMDGVLVDWDYLP